MKNGSLVASAPRYRRYERPGFRSQLPAQQALLLEPARTGKISLAISDAILGEMEDVLRRKFGWADDAIADRRERITAMVRKVKPAVQLDVVKEDPDDNRILESASASASECIVTGDRHLLKLGRYDSVRILNVSDFLRLLQEGAERI